MLSYQFLFKGCTAKKWTSLEITQWSMQLHKWYTACYASCIHTCQVDAWSAVGLVLVVPRICFLQELLYWRLLFVRLQDSSVYSSQTILLLFAVFGPVFSLSLSDSLYNFVWPSSYNSLFNPCQKCLRRNFACFPFLIFTLVVNC